MSLPTEAAAAPSLAVLRQQTGGLPPVLDVLIVGGGPAGTMAAFRAKELGLAALVIDYDDVLKRIRDYSKDKLILPNFGGGDQMRFPKGGELCSRLHFSPIDKDEMHRSWRRLYVEYEVPVEVGVELTALSSRPDGVWDAKAWDHQERRDRSYACRHVVIAIGRGVPRRFDIPGNTDGVAFRLSDPSLYVGRPACVIGGGTSAAEAVIAISNAKAAAEDPSTVFWSYRGEKMPRASKALAEVFFDAYLGNGNISYHPRSEPVAVFTAEDRQEYLSIRITRRLIDGRPNETTHLEFPKECCVACIGEDIPEAFLGSVGIHMVSAGDAGRKRMLVTPLLETEQPNVYMAGDMLSQAYLETDHFAADPASWREVKHKGNVKAALRDGVLLAGVIAQKLAGKTEIRVELEDAEEAAAAALAAEPNLARSFIQVVESDGPPAAAGTGAAAAGSATTEVPAEESAAGVAAEAPARLVRVLPGGVDEDEAPIPLSGTLTLGRGGCDLSFPDDSGLSERHASVSQTPEGYYLRDDGGATGVFLRARSGEPVTLDSGAIVRAGRQFLVVAGNELRHFNQQGQEVARYPVSEKPAIFGRDAPDVTLDAGDLTLSRRHLTLAAKDGKVVLKDLKSVNGTFVKVRAAAPLAAGDEFRLGRQVFRFVLGEKAMAPPAVVAHRPVSVAIALASLAAPPAGPSPAVPAAASAAPASAPSAAPPLAGAAGVAVASVASAAAAQVTFQGSGQTFAIRKGQSVCELAEENGIAITAECHAGLCGSDPVRIVAGAQFLNKIEDSESGTLEDLCGLKPGECRLACMLRVQGPVVVEIVKR
jgi:thioredoxin reductase/pSer/pThr/pTyr-binding forkhead associated (FHA) protein/ferredoxin